jgi:hypothetical protein
MLMPFPITTHSYLSMRQAGKGVILELATQDLKVKVEKIIKAELIARTSVSTSLMSPLPVTITVIHCFFSVYSIGVIAAGVSISMR